MAEGVGDARGLAAEAGGAAEADAEDTEVDMDEAVDMIEVDMLSAVSSADNGLGSLVLKRHGQ